MKINQVLLFSIIVATLGLFLVPTAKSGLLLPSIDLGGDSTADIHVAIFENNSAFCNGLTSDSLNNHTIFAVHGLSSNAGVWQNLSNALFINNPTGGIVCRVLAIEMPGHGGSGLPTNILFGELSHLNYANAILNTLTVLAQQGIRPISLIAHSNGALNLQVAQQILTNQGSSFSDMFGVEKITFLAGVPSAPVVWPFAQELADVLEAVANCFSETEILPGCGVFDVEPDGDVDWDDIQVLDPFGIIFDCNPLTVPIGIPVAPPNCENLTILGDRQPGIEPEPLNIFRSVFGAAPQMRPVTQSGIFGGNGAILQVIAFEMDNTVGPPSVHLNLFNHLTNGTNGTFFLVEGPGTNHGFFDIDPEGFLEAITGPICLLPPTPTPPPPPVQIIIIPTMGQWGMIAATVLLGFFAIRMLRNRKDSES